MSPAHRSSAAALLALLAPLTGGARAQDAPAPTAAGRVFVEVEATPAVAFVGQPVAVVLRVGVDRAFLAEHVVQPFPAPLDVPLQIGAPWLDEPPGASVLDAAQPDGPRATCALDGDLARLLRRADRVVDGHPWLVLEIHRTWLPAAPGKLTIPPAKVVVHWAERFRDDFLLGRTPEQVRQETVTSEPVDATIAPLPDADRPADFGGAVGTFTVRASLDRDTVRLGEPFALRLEIVADAPSNLAHVEPPLLDALDGFHVVGRLDAASPLQRTAVFELAALRINLREVPPIAWSWFDPGPPARYVTARTDALALTVERPSDGAPPLPIPGLPGSTLDGPGFDVLDPLREPPPPAPVPAPPSPAADALGPRELLPIAVGPPPASASRVDLGATLALLLAPLAWALAIASWRHTRRGDPRVRRARRDRDAARRAVLAAPASERARAFAAWLADRQGWTAARVVAPGLADRLVADGMARELAARAATLLQRLLAQRYSGTATPEPGDDGLADLLVRVDAAANAEEAT
ncbi:MAG: BatD family protein [Planctomycetes bacterium]|nr:BatD family protein [Planctomycetota bacterium]